jgi:hypothetical protein
MYLNLDFQFLDRQSTRVSPLRDVSEQKLDIPCIDVHQATFTATLHTQIDADQATLHQATLHIMFTKLLYTATLHTQILYTRRQLKAQYAKKNSSFKAKSNNRNS